MMPRRACLALGAVLIAGVASAQSADELFRQGVDAYRRGEHAAATDALKAALARNPGHAQAFEMIDSIEQRVLMDMLTERGEIGTLTGRLIDLGRIGRLDVVSDPGGAADVVDELLTGDLSQQHSAMLMLQSRYGQWAVPALVGPLGDGSSIDNRVKAMQALSRLGSTAVLPLTEVLHSDSVLLRSNAAAVLGTLGDRRALAALAWMARADEDQVARQVAAEALGKLGQPGADPVMVSLALADGYFRGVPELSKPYDASTIVWSWSDGQLQGQPVLGGLHPLRQAEKLAHQALAEGAGDQARALLAAIHAAQKAEILAAQGLDALSGHELVEQAAERLPDIEVDLALAGRARGQGLMYCLTSTPRRGPAAVQLMAAMGNSAAELQALRTALADPDASVSQAAALALGRLGEFDGHVVARLGEAVAGVPQRVAVSIGLTGLGGGAAGWQVIHATTVQDGLLSAKAFPPKDAVVIQDGLQGVTLDTMIFGLRNDPRTADVPIVVVTRDVGGVEGLYGDDVQKVVSSAGAADLAEVAGERSARVADALDRARAAAATLAVAPPSLLRQAAGAIAAALDSGADSDLLAAVLHVVARGGLVEALPRVEALLADDGADTAVRTAAMRAAASLWGIAGTSTDHSGVLLAAMDEGDPDLAAAAAAALGQLQGVPPSTLADAVR